MGGTIHICDAPVHTYSIIETEEESSLVNICSVVVSERGR